MYVIFCVNVQKCKFLPIYSLLLRTSMCPKFSQSFLDPHSPPPPSPLSPSSSSHFCVNVTNEWSLIRTWFSLHFPGANSLCIGQIENLSSIFWLICYFLSSSVTFRFLSIKTGRLLNIIFHFVSSPEIYINTKHCT